MFQQLSMRWRAVLIGVVVLGLAMVGTWAFAGMSIVRDGPQADEGAGVAGRWTGTVRQKVSRSSKWFKVSYTAQGDFWFTVDDKGDVSGYAALTYQPEFGTAEADAVLNYAKNVGNLHLGLLHIPGVVLGTELNKLVGVTSENPEPMPVRKGPITGRLKDGELSLRWAGDEPQDGIPYRISLAYVDRKEVILNERFPVHDPWPAGAVRSRAGRPLVVVSSQEEKPTDDYTTTLSTYWSAQRSG